MKSKIFQHDVRIYYEDTDMGGIVYYANYLKFLERGRTEMLRELGFDQQKLKIEEDLIFVVRHIEADYIKTAVYGDELRVATSVAEIKRARLSMRQDVLRDGELIFCAQVTLVAVDAGAMKARRVPEAIVAALG